MTASLMVMLLLAQAPDDVLAQIAGVKRVYVDRLTGGETAAQMRDLIISSLQGSKLFVLTENTDRADAFLRGMMRSFTGALVKVGQGRAAPEWIGSIVDAATARDPSLSVAPARGLHQWSVRYEPAAKDQELAA